MANARWQDKTSRRTQARPAGWKKIRERVIKRDNGVCQQRSDDHGHGPICGQPARNVDHIIPAHQGGTDDIDNLQLLCDPHERHKTSSEAGRASAAAAARRPRRRPAEQHPGLLA